VRYLLDTHAWIWAVLGDGRLGARARAALRSSPAEAAWLLSRRRIVIEDPTLTWPAWLRAAATAPGIDVLPLTPDIAIASEQFTARFPRDPADRLIGATARVHDLTVVTRDRGIRRSREVPVLW
jgi:PIN domain nuclease of toxin-antitoxin system